MGQIERVFTHQREIQDVRLSAEFALLDVVANPTMRMLREAMDCSSDLLDASDHFFALSHREISVDGPGMQWAKEALANGLPTIILSTHPSGLTLFAVGTALRQEFDEHRQMIVLANGMNRGLHPLLDQYANFVEPIVVDYSAANIMKRPYVIFERRKDPEEVKEQNHYNLIEFAYRVNTSKLGVIFPDGHKAGKAGLGVGVVLQYLGSNLGTDANIIGVSAEGFNTASVLAEDWIGEAGLPIHKHVTLHILGGSYLHDFAIDPTRPVDFNRHTYTKTEKSYYKALAQEAMQLMAA